MVVSAGLGSCEARFNWKSGVRQVQEHYRDYNLGESAAFGGPTSAVLRLWARRANDKPKQKTSGQSAEMSRAADLRSDAVEHHLDDNDDDDVCQSLARVRCMPVTK